MATNNPCDRNLKKTGSAIVSADKVDFKPRRIEREKKGPYILGNGTIQQESIISTKYTQQTTS